MSPDHITTTPLLIPFDPFTRSTRAELTITGVPGSACTATVAAHGLIMHLGYPHMFTAAVFWDSCDATYLPTYDDISCDVEDESPLHDLLRQSIITALARPARDCALLLGYQWPLTYDATTSGDLAASAHSQPSAQFY